MSYRPDHGDIYIIGDKKQLAFSLGDGVKGTNYTLVANQWYTAGQRISKGQSVSIGTSEYATLIGSGSAGDVYIASEGDLDKTCGIALNDALLKRTNVFSITSVTGATPGTITFGGGCTIPALTLTSTDILSPQTVAAKIATVVDSGTWSWVPSVVNNQITFTSLSINAVDITISLGTATNIVFSSIIASVKGDPVEVQSYGLHTWSSNIFSSSDIGNTVYIAPGVFSYSTPLADQYTTNRSRAAASGYPLIELGIVQSVNSIFVDFEGDSRGSVTTTQTTAPAGEALTTNGVPMLVSLGTDGKVYFADRRKSTDGVMTTSIFSVTSVASATAGTVVLAGGASATITLTADDILSTSAVAAKIAAAIVSNWTLTSNSNVVSMYSPISGIAAPTIALGTATNITFSTVTTTTSGLGRTKPLGFVVSADSGFSSTIAINTNCLIQRLGTISYSAWGFTPGKPIYNDINGAYTQNTTTFSNYTDVCTPVAMALSATSIYVQVAYSIQTADAESLASIIACNSTGTADYGYLLCCGSTMNATTTTTNPSGQIAGIYDGTGLFNKIGSCFGGTIQYTVSGTTTVGANFSINGIVYTATGTTASALVDQIAAITQSNYTFAEVSTYVFSISNVAGYSTPSIVAPTGITIVISGGTYTLPNLNASVVKLQIKYLNWYAANPSVAPSYRYDTGWTQYPNVPSNCLGTGVNGGYIEVPVSSFGSNPDATELIAEIYATKNGVYRKLDCAAHIDPLTSNAKYGYQINKASNDYLRIDTSTAGLAYFNYSTQLWVALDNTWQYKVIITKSEKYNKFYDYTGDQKLSQMWSLGLVDYSAPYTSQIAGKFDRSTLLPTHTTRLNYDGVFYAHHFVTANGVVLTSSSINQYLTSNDLNTRSIYSPKMSIATVNITDSDLIAICWSPELSIFCALGTTKSYISYDGITWTSASLPSDPYSSPKISICWSPEQQVFCALSHRFGAGSGTISALLSADGLDWTTYSITGDINIKSVCWSSELELFCAVGQGGYILTSPNGINWTIQGPFVNTPTFISIVWSSERSLFFALSEDGRYSYFSSTGASWTGPVVVNGNTSVLMRSVCWSAELGLFCAIGSLSSASLEICTSRDAATWVKTTVYVSGASGTAAVNVIWVKELSVFLVTLSNFIITSPDGIKWDNYYASSLANKTNMCYQTAWAPALSKFCSTLNNTTGIAYSLINAASVVVKNIIPDINMDSAPSVSSMIRWIADYEKWKGFTQILSSFTNQVTATGALPQYNVIGVSKLLRRAVLLPRQSLNSAYYIDLDSTPYSLVSTTLPATMALADVCWSDYLRMFVAVGSNSLSQSIIIYSYDGITWSSASNPGSYYYNAICWSPAENKFYILANNAGNTVLYSSLNGINWTLEGTFTNFVPKCQRIVYCDALKSVIWIHTSSSVSNYIMYWNGAAYGTITFPYESDFALDLVTYSPELNIFMAYTNNNTSYYYVSSSFEPGVSLNLIKWTKVWYGTSLSLSKASAIEWIPEIHAFVAKLSVTATDVGSVIAISKDGFNWSLKYHLPMLTSDTAYSDRAANSRIRFDPVNNIIITCMDISTTNFNIYQSRCIPNNKV